MSSLLSSDWFSSWFRRPAQPQPQQPQQPQQSPQAPQRPPAASSAAAPARRPAPAVVDTLAPASRPEPAPAANPVAPADRPRPAASGQAPRAASPAPRPAPAQPHVRTPAHAHAHGHGHGGHSHGGMSTFVMDIDEIMAFAAPRFTAALARPARALTHAGARLVNVVTGRPAISAVQASRAGATLATGGGLAVVAGGIHYACVAAVEAQEGMVHSRHERAAWDQALNGVPAAPARAGQSRLRRLLRSRGITGAARERLVRLAEAQRQRHGVATVGKAAAVVGSGLMAATLLFSAEFVPAMIWPALAELGHACMHVAIPAMALYGLCSAYNAVRGLVANVRTYLGLGQLDAATRAALAPHLSRLRRGMACEAAVVVGGVGLAAGLFLQMTLPLTGLTLLALGTFTLEGATFGRNVLLGDVTAKALLARGSANVLRPRAQALLARMDTLQAAERALASHRPGRVASLRQAWLRLTGQRDAKALQARLAATLAELAPVRTALAENAAPLADVAATPPLASASAQAALQALDALDLLPALGHRLEATAALASPVHLHDDATPAAKQGAYAAWRDKLASAQLGEVEARAFYAAALETLWTEGAERALTRYGEIRAVCFARLA